VGLCSRDLRPKMCHRPVGGMRLRMGLRVGDHGVTSLSGDVISGVRLIRCQNGESESPG